MRASQPGPSRSVDLGGGQGQGQRPRLSIPESGPSVYPQNGHTQTPHLAQRNYEPHAGQSADNRPRSGTLETPRQATLPPLNASSTSSAPLYTNTAPVPFGPVPNSLAPALLQSTPQMPTPLPGLDAFDFASAFHQYDEHDHDHEDGVENDLAIDWPTMSSGNGAGSGGLTDGLASGGGIGSNTVGSGNGIGVGAMPGQMGQGRQAGSTLSSGFSPLAHTAPRQSLDASSGNIGPNGQTLPAFTLQPPSSTSSSIPRPRIRDRDRDFQIEDIIPWHTISFFITIYLGYSHSLFPMVHRPSFSQRLALREDKRNKDFRALVLGIGELYF